MNNDSVPSSYDDPEEEDLSDNLLFQIYVYSRERLHQTRQQVGCFRSVLRPALGLGQGSKRGEMKDKDDPQNTFINKIEDFNTLFLALEGCLCDLDEDGWNPTRERISLLKELWSLAIKAADGAIKSKTACEMWG